MILWNTDILPWCHNKENHNLAVNFYYSWHKIPCELCPKFKRQDIKWYNTGQEILMNFETMHQFKIFKFRLKMFTCVVISHIQRNTVLIMNWNTIEACFLINILDPWNQCNISQIHIPFSMYLQWNYKANQ